MATDVPAWSGTGWPVELFADERTGKRKVLYCARNHCRRILRDPWQLECGHRYCHECLDKIRHDENPICVMCAQDIMYDDFSVYDQTPMNESEIDDRVKDITKIDANKAFTDHAAQKEVLRLLVKCPWNCNTGKTQTHLKLRDLQNHLKTCQMRKVQCDLCGDQFPFKQLDYHLQSTCSHREIICPNACGISGLKEHRAQCKKRPEVCRACKKVIPAGQSLYRHFQEDCRGDCPFNCQNKKRDELLSKHLQTESLMGYHVTSLIAKQKEISDSLENDRNTVTDKQTENEIKSIMSDVLSLEDRTSRLQDDQASTLEKYHDQMPQAATNLAAADKMQSDLSLLQTKIDDLAQDVHQMSTRYMTFGHLKRSITQEMDVVSQKIKKLENTSKLRDATNKDIEMMISDYQRASYDGILIWRVDNVSSLRELSKRGERHSIYSNPFYSDVYGYKMCMRLYLNGDGNGKNTHVSLFFVMMKGEFDALLSWPFEHKVNMTLLNQTGVKPPITEKFRPERTSSSFERPKNEKNVASGCPQFATQSTIFNPEHGYVVDDTMFFKVTIDKNVEPPTSGLVK